MPGRDPARGARDTGRSDRGLGDRGRDKAKGGKGGAPTGGYGGSRTPNGQKALSNGGRTSDLRGGFRGPGTGGRGGEPSIDDIISGKGFPSAPAPGAPSVNRNKKGVTDHSLFSDRKYTDPYSTGKMGPTITPEEADKLGSLTPNEAADVMSARYGWDNRPKVDGWDLLDFLAGPFIDLAKPTPLNPNTYQNGAWHTYTNPGGVLGLAAGALSGIPFLGTAGSYGWQAADLPMVYHNDLMPDQGQTQTAANPDVTPENTNYSATPAPALKSLSPLNNRIGGYSGGGYNMGAFGKKPSKKTNYLTQQLMAP